MPSEQSLPTVSADGVYSNYFLVSHKDLNHSGTLFGGTMMAWADELAYVAASLTYPRCDFVTKVFETFDFIGGAERGAIVRIDARVVSKGRSSVRVQVSGSWAVNGLPIFSTHAVMVNAKDGRAVAIPNICPTA
jgi:acyl-CoA hydrolase